VKRGKQEKHERREVQKAHKNSLLALSISWTGKMPNARAESQIDGAHHITVAKMTTNMKTNEHTRKNEGGKEKKRRNE
jgi:hypothetical protein